MSVHIIFVERGFLLQPKAHCTSSSARVGYVGSFSDRMGLKPEILPLLRG